jgi:hypothetical protein
MSSGDGFIGLLELLLLLVCVGVVLDLFDWQPATKNTPDTSTALIQFFIMTASLRGLGERPSLMILSTVQGRELNFAAYLHNGR